MKTSLLAIIGFAVICAIVFKNTEAAMTMDQLHEAGIMLRKSCTTKSKVDKALLTKMDLGELTDNKELKCYMFCIHKTMMMAKKGRYSPDKAIAQYTKFLPESVKQLVLDVVVKCREAGAKFTDPCEVSYQHVACAFREGKDYIFFP